MNPAISAATTVTTIAAAQAAKRREQLLAALRALPPGEATRQRLLAEHPELADPLDAAIASGLVREHASGRLRVDLEGARAKGSQQAKIALLVVASISAVIAGVVLALLAFAR